MHRICYKPEPKGRTMPTHVKKSKRKKTTKKATDDGKDDKPEGYVFGRPTKYDPKYCKTVIEYMSKGYSKEACAGAIGIDKVTLYEWAKKYPDFSNAISRGVELSRLAWERMAVENAVFSPKGQQLNAQVWGLNMKNRFNWSDKKETTHEIGEETKKTLAFDFTTRPKHKED